MYWNKSIAEIKSNLANLSPAAPSQQILWYVFLAAINKKTAVQLYNRYYILSLVNDLTKTMYNIQKINTQSHMVHINVVAQALATTVQSCAKMGKFYFHFTLDTPKKKKTKIQHMLYSIGGQLYTQKHCELKYSIFFDSINRKSKNRTKTAATHQWKYNGMHMCRFYNFCCCLCAQCTFYFLWCTVIHNILYIFIWNLQNGVQDELWQ